MTFGAADIALIQAITPAVKGDAWSYRWDVAWYVSQCEMAGFAKTADEKMACAKRYLAGKRKISPPGTERRKKAERLKRKIVSSPPQELVDAIQALKCSKAYEQFIGGNEKALNALVGLVLKEFKTDPSAIRELIQKI